jgi:DNA-binding MarR family transcriptional regulator
MSDPLTLEEQVIAALRRITRAIDLHSRLLLQKHGLTAPQLAALQTIQRMQPITVGALAKAIHLSQGTVTGILGRLEDRGLVVRARGNQDRRSVLVELTGAGQELAREAPSLLQERFHRELSRLQEWEQTMILATLQRIASMMDAEKIEAVPVLGAGVAGAVEEDVSRYLERAVVPTDETPFAEESPGTIPPSFLEDPGADQDEPRSDA